MDGVFGAAPEGLSETGGVWPSIGDVPIAGLSKRREAAQSPALPAANPAKANGTLAAGGTDTAGVDDGVVNTGKAVFGGVPGEREAGGEAAGDASAASGAEGAAKTDTGGTEPPISGAETGGAAGIPSEGAGSVTDAVVTVIGVTVGEKAGVPRGGSVG